MAQEITEELWHLMPDGSCVTAVYAGWEWGLVFRNNPSARYYVEADRDALPDDSRTQAFILWREWQAQQRERQRCQGIADSYEGPGHCAAVDIARLIGIG